MHNCRLTRDVAGSPGIRAHAAATGMLLLWEGWRGSFSEARMSSSYIHLPQHRAGSWSITKEGWHGAVFWIARLTRQKRGARPDVHCVCVVLGYRRHKFAKSCLHATLSDDKAVQGKSSQ